MENSLKELANQLSPERIIELVTELGSDSYIEKADYIQFKTICHNINSEEASYKLYYYKKNKKFHCYTECGDNFNIYELFKRRYELLGIDYDFYHDIVLKIFPNIYTESVPKKQNKIDFDKYKLRKVEVNYDTINPTILQSFVFFPTREWLDDGISAEAMKEFNILYSISQNKVIIPHYDINGNLVGIRGRALEEEDLVFGKYLPVQVENKTYAHALGYNLYGLNKNKENIKKCGVAIVAEGEKSVLQYETMFGRESNICVATCGSSFHSYQLDLLLSAGARKVIIAFDKEGLDWRGEQYYYEKLENICKRHCNKCNMGFIFDTQNLLELKQSPFDRGKDVFTKLLKTVQWV